MIRRASQPWPRITHWLLVLSIPIVLLALSIRVTTHHWFIQREYNQASFPPDPYGLSTAERIDLAKVCVDYLADNASISLLMDLKLPSGEPAFNARELRHMIDVQMVYNRLMIVGVFAALTLTGGTMLLLVTGQPHELIAAALARGSLLSLGLLAAVGIFMALSWGEFFTSFHRLFFEGNSWTFPLSTTLIRLFPTRFWMDVAVIIVGSMTIGAIVLGGLGWTWKYSGRLHS